MLPMSIEQEIGSIQRKKDTNTFDKPYTRALIFL